MRTPVAGRGNVVDHDIPLKRVILREHNIIRAAMIPEFMAGCLERDGDTLSAKQRASVEKIVYAEITFDEEGDIMDMTDI